MLRTVDDPKEEASGGPAKVLRLTPFFHHEIASDWPARFDPVGGQQIQCLTQSRWLARRGIAQQVVTSGFPGLPPHYCLEPGLDIYPAPFRMPQIPSKTTGLVGLTRNWYWTARLHLARSFRADGWRPDLVHVHADGQIEALWLASHARRRFRRPVVLTLHCSRIANYRPMTRWDHFWHRRVKAAEQRAVRDASAVVCLSRETHDAIAAAIPEACGRLTVIPDALDLVRFRSAANASAGRASCTRFGLTENRPTLAFIGRIAQEKGWPTIIEALQHGKMADWHLLVVGDGPQRVQFEQEVRARGLAGRVVVTGFLDHAGVAGLLANVTVLVMPSVHEEFGGSAIEALALGIPVVAHAVGGLRETIGSVEPALLVSPGDTEGLVRRILDAGARADYVAAATARGRRWAETSCDQDVVLPRLLPIYRSCCRQSSS